MVKEIELASPFKVATCSVLEMILGEMPEFGEPGPFNSDSTCSDITVTCSVIGSASGSVFYTMSEWTALRIAESMVGIPCEEMDELAASAIAELSNMISGNGLLGLSEMGLIGDLAPPTLVRGSNIHITTFSIPGITIPFHTCHGDFWTTVALRKIK